MKKKMMQTGLVLNLLLLLCLSRASFGQQGFISLDCGLPSDSSYTNEVGYNYTSDAAYIDSGESKRVASIYMSQVEAMYHTLRSFPNYQRNCYSLKPVIAGNRYLVRASFMYGDYDGKYQLPSFDLYLGPDFWYSVNFDNVSHVVWTEIIGRATSSSMSVCLLQTSNGGTPLISGLELRPLDDNIYALLANTSDAMITYKRIDTGSNRQQRFMDDPYDRIWTPDYNAYGAPRNTTESIALSKGFMLPQAVAQTAVASIRPIVISWAAGPSDRFYFFIYISELQRFPVPQTRNITITKNGQPVTDPFDPHYLGMTTIYTEHPMREENYTFSIWVTRTSTLGPILNAFEIYKTCITTGYATYGRDGAKFPNWNWAWLWRKGEEQLLLLSNIEWIDAIASIKAYYQVKRNWGGDPCLPKQIPWDGLGCDYDKISTPVITSIDLSNSELTGNITHFFSKLTALRTLNLSGNHLQGSIPDFFVTMMSLTVLDLSNNDLTGTVPKALQERKQNGTLQLRITNNHLSEASTSQANKMSNGMIYILLVACCVLLIN